MFSDESWQRILVCAAHPDDETMGAGGSIARWAEEGAAISLVVFTKAYPPDWEDELVAQKRVEVRAAVGNLGVSDITFLDFRAAELDVVPQRVLNDQLAEVIADKRPTTVVTTHRGDIHADHRIVFETTMVATRPLPGSSVRRVLAYEALSSTEWAPPVPERLFMPTFYVDITTTIDLKLKALARYETEIRDFPHPRSIGAVRALAAKRGSEVGLRAAEAFQLVREIH
jgi:N-acetylglucosamine malate deacetylase 1